MMQRMRIEALSELYKQAIQLEYQLQDDTYTHRFFMVRSNIQEVLIVDTFLSDCVHMNLLSKSNGYDKRTLDFITEKVIRQYHPKQIILDRIDGFTSNQIQAAGYFVKGDHFQKVIDPDRLKMEDMIFDDEGYIIHQGKIKDVSFGFFNSSRNGCGWIAAYNILKMLGKEKPISYCANSLSRFSITGKLFGQEFFTLYHWLRKEGVKAKLSLVSQRSAIQHMKNSLCGILLYTHKKGSHYTSYRYLDGSSVHFYNAVYGSRNHFMDPEEFMKTKAFLPVAMLIYVEEV